MTTRSPDTKRTCPLEGPLIVKKHVWNIFRNIFCECLRVLSTTDGNDNIEPRCVAGERAIWPPHIRSHLGGRCRGHQRAVELHHDPQLVMNQFGHTMVIVSMPHPIFVCVHVEHVRLLQGNPAVSDLLGFGRVMLQVGTGMSSVNPEYFQTKR